MKTLDDYLAMPYEVEVMFADGTWVAWITGLDGCIVYGDSWETVLHMIQESKQVWLKNSLASGFTIPEPAIVMS